MYAAPQLDRSQTDCYESNSSEVDAGHYLAPIFTIHEGRLLASMDPDRVGRHPKMENYNIPALTSEQQHALDMLSESASRSELPLKLQTGDLLFFNNWALLHRRGAYEDDEESSRHLVRLWVRNQSLGWAIPASMSPPWQEAYGETTKAKLYPLAAPKEYRKPKFVTGSAAYLPKSSE